MNGGMVKQKLSTRSGRRMGCIMKKLKQDLAQKKNFYLVKKVKAIVETSSGNTILVFKFKLKLSLTGSNASMTISPFKALFKQLKVNP